MRRFAASTALVLLCAVTPPMLADGGAVLFVSATNSVAFTVFVSPSPVHAGQADLSVLLQRETDRTAILSADVRARIQKSGRPELAVTLTHAAATDKLLYAAMIDLPESGTYRVSVSTRSAAVSGSLVVLPEEAPLATYWPLFAVVPAAIALFFLNRHLKSARSRS